MFESIFTKLSQYNILTNILPGTVLCIVFKYLVGYNFFVTTDPFQLFVIFYFVGLVNNRIGSVLIEPLLKAVHLVKFAPHKDFVAAEAKDPKISTLSQENNTFRSYISLFANALFAKAIHFCPAFCDSVVFHGDTLMMLFLLVVFIFSYRKQTGYIRSRIEKATESHQSEGN